MAERPLADRWRLPPHSAAPQRRRNHHELFGIFGDELARIPVQARNPALAVVAGEARVRCVFGARDAVAARAADGRGHELPAREAVPVPLDDGERLVPEHEQPLVLGCDPEQALGDLPVGAADADLERADEHLALTRVHAGDVLDARRVRLPGLRDEREHYAAVRPPSITKTLPVTKPAASEARYATASPPSSGVPRRPSGCRAVSSSRDSPASSTSLRTQGESTVPGQTALTRMLSFTWSTASARVSETTAPCDAQ